MVKIPKPDLERVHRVSAFLRTEQGLLSAHLVLSTGMGVSVYRDGKVALRRPLDEDTVDLEPPRNPRERT